MKARQLIDGASFGPEALKAIGAAFDGAWADVSAHFANEESRDGAVLKRAALQRMALDYRRRR